jgi:predicted deacylase
VHGAACGFAIRSHRAPSIVSARELTSVALPVTSPGTRAQLTVLRYGRAGARPKAYLQASLHADEIPGMLVLNHLASLLDAVCEQVRGEIVLVPVANPLGLAQVVSGRVLGRHALTGAGNFNRQFPDLRRAAGERLEGCLGDDAQANVREVRRALGAALEALTPVDETQWLRHTLLGLALDADIALDLHCDSDALLHLYMGTALWPAGADLSAQLGSRATLLAEDSGGTPFDEAVAGPWWALARQFPRCPLPPACLAATVELRGERDVDDELAAQDARNLLRFLQRRAVIAGEPGAVPPPRCAATPFEGVDLVRAPAAGVIASLVTLGERVRAGDPVAEIVDPLDLDRHAKRAIVRSATAGLVFARTDQRLARPGQVLAKVAGEAPLAHRRPGALLSD